MQDYIQAVDLPKEKLLYNIVSEPKFTVLLLLLE